jgi:hypothetical protein
MCPVAVLSPMLSKSTWPQFTTDSKQTIKLSLYEILKVVVVIAGNDDNTT